MGEGLMHGDSAVAAIDSRSLHDALPIWARVGRDIAWKPWRGRGSACGRWRGRGCIRACRPGKLNLRSEEHTSELQSQSNLVCRLLLEKKKNKIIART